MKIVKLKSENVKRLEAVLIEPDESHLVTLVGKNKSGKTSVLDSIMMAIGGADAIPDMPVRRGQQKAEIKLKLRNDEGKDLIVTRTIKPDRTTTLSVTSADGAKFPSPQAMLDALYGSLTFDPVAFENMKPVDQVATLKRLAGIDAEYDKLIRQRQCVFDQRTDVNRQVKLLDGQIAGMPEAAGVPPQRVDVTALMAKRRDMEIVKAKNAALVSDVAVAGSLVLSVKARLASQSKRIEELDVALSAARSEAGRIESEMELAAGQLRDVEEKVKASTVPDFAEIDREIAQSDSINRKVDEQARRSAVLVQRFKAAEQAKALTDNIEALDLATRTLIEQAKLPIAGLAVTDTGVTFTGIPFDQCSSAERLRVSMAMGMAMHSKLRVMLIRDASLLDDDNMAMIRDLAKAEDYQLWIERVGSDDASAIIIEDGKIKETY